MSGGHQNTFEEFEEASYAIGLAKEKRHENNPVRLLISVGVLAIYLFTAAVLWGHAGVGQAVVWLNLVFPFSATMLMLSLAQSASQFWAGNWRRIRWLPQLGPAVLLAFVIAYAWQLRASGQIGWVFLLPNSTWLVMTAYFSFVTLNRAVSGVPKRLRKVWDVSVSLHRSKTADISVQSVRITDLVSQIELQWAAFARFQETPNLFLLFLAENQKLMLPKKAFASEAEANALRSLCKNLITQMKPAFEVVPIGESPAVSTAPSPT